MDFHHNTSDSCLLYKSVIGLDVDTDDKKGTTCIISVHSTFIYAAALCIISGLLFLVQIIFVVDLYFVILCLESRNFIQNLQTTV